MRKVMLLLAVALATVMVWGATAYAEEVLPDPGGTLALDPVRSGQAEPDYSEHPEWDDPTGEVVESTIADDGSTTRAAINDNELVSCGNYSVSLSATEAGTIRAINNWRNNSKPNLCVDRRLMRAARYWSRYMLYYDTFQHGDTYSRLAYFNYPVQNYWWGENLYYRTTPANGHDAVAAWSRSQSHYNIMASPNARAIGVGTPVGDFRGNRVRMFTADFGGKG